MGSARTHGCRSTISSDRAGADAVLLAQVECKDDQESGLSLIHI